METFGSQLEVLEVEMNFKGFFEFRLLAETVRADLRHSDFKKVAQETSKQPHAIYM